MRISTLITTAILAVGGLLLTSCGDDTEALPKPEYLEQANAICQEANDQIEPIFMGVWDEFDELDEEDPAAQDDIFTAWAEAFSEIVPIWSQSVDDVRALGAPEGDEELIDDLLDDFDTALAFYLDTSADAADGDEDARALLDSSADDPFDDVNQRAHDYGLTVCGSEE